MLHPVHDKLIKVLELAFHPSTGEAESAAAFRASRSIVQRNGGTVDAILRVKAPSGDDDVRVWSLTREIMRGNDREAEMSRKIAEAEATIRTQGECIEAMRRLVEQTGETLAMARMVVERLREAEEDLDELRVREAHLRDRLRRRIAATRAPGVGVAAHETLKARHADLRAKLASIAAISRTEDAGAGAGVEVPLVVPPLDGDPLAAPETQPCPVATDVAPRKPRVRLTDPLRARLKAELEATPTRSYRIIGATLAAEFDLPITARTIGCIVWRRRKAGDPVSEVVRPYPRRAVKASVRAVAPKPSRYFRPPPAPKGVLAMPYPAFAMRAGRRASAPGRWEAEFAAEIGMRVESIRNWRVRGKVPAGYVAMLERLERGEAVRVEAVRRDETVHAAPSEVRIDPVVGLTKAEQMRITLLHMDEPETTDDDLRAEIERLRGSPVEPTFVRGCPEALDDVVAELAREWDEAA